MPVTELQHYFVRANDLERSRRFYCDVLGFELMPCGPMWIWILPFTPSQ